MRNDPDPSVHRQRQQLLVAHVQRLLENDRFVLPTTAGPKPVTSFYRDVVPGDDAYAVKQKMIELGLSDRDLQRKMPTGQSLDVTLSQQSFFGGKQPVGKVRVLAVSPTASLLKGESAAPADRSAVQRALNAPVPPPLPGALPLPGNLPQTVVVISTSGFEKDVASMAGRRPDGGAVVLVGMNEAGGWDVVVPAGMESIVPLLDPETISQKKERARDAIEESGDLLTGGVSAATLAERVGVSPELAAEVLRDYAERVPGLAVGTFEGTLVLYPTGAGASSGGLTGEAMPFWEKVKGMVGLSSDTPEKQAARLAQEKALLAQQRTRAYAEIETVEQKEAELTASFPKATPLAQKRIATEISQLRKRVERVQQLVSTIDKKINIVETGMHNLEMERHLSKKKLAALEDVATSSANVDEGMATLDQLNEAADAVSVVGSEMSVGANDVLAELQAKFAAAEAADEENAPAARAPGQQQPASPARERAASAAPPPPLPNERRRVPGAAEPG